MEKIFEETGRNTFTGARTEAKIYGPDGTEIVSAREFSKTGNHWTDRFTVDSETTYLVVVVDLSNSGKDNSCTRIEGPGKLSPIQEEIKQSFRRRHPFAF